MLFGSKKSRRPLICIFTVAALIAFLFAWYTEHTWEDYYITYRTSKNLASGIGLVFSKGIRLQTFTSPIGVLLPAFGSFVVFNSSDEAALWIFRVVSITAFSSAAAMLFAGASNLRFSNFARLALVCFLITDAKSIDFSINGMETAFMLFFITYTFWASFSPRKNQAFHLGLAWAGLMWSRPDSFIYIAVYSFGIWLFNSTTQTTYSRLGWLKVCGWSALLCAVLYLPWFLFAWFYYGSPVPYTIIAKSGVVEDRSLGGFWISVLSFPINSWISGNTLEAIFMPSYYEGGGWPLVLREASLGLGAICALIWLVPNARTDAKAASFSFLVANLYLSYFPPYPSPWYLCVPGLLGFLALSGVLAQVWEKAGMSSAAWPRRLVIGACSTATLAIVCAAAWLTTQSAKQLKIQQQLIEIGNRRKIGEWLHVNARKSDTVFLEPLGYISYFSQLKMYDFPGLSSPEVVRAIQKVGRDWSAIIVELQPDWLVLRPKEIAQVEIKQPLLLSEIYRPVKLFDERTQVKESRVYGRDYLDFDSVFVVFHRQQSAP